jgi:hypothetical protein
MLSEATVAELQKTKRGRKIQKQIETDGLEAINATMDEIISILDGQHVAVAQGILVGASVAIANLIAADPQEVAKDIYDELQARLQQRLNQPGELTVAKAQLVGPDGNPL